MATQNEFSTVLLQKIKPGKRGNASCTEFGKKGKPHSYYILDCTFLPGKQSQRREPADVKAHREASLLLCIHLGGNHRKETIPVSLPPECISQVGSHFFVPLARAGMQLPIYRTNRHLVCVISKGLGNSLINGRQSRTRRAPRRCEHHQHYLCGVIDYSVKGGSRKRLHCWLRRTIGPVLFND